MSHKKFIKDLKLIKKELEKLPVKSDITSLKNRLIALLSVTTGEDSPHISFVRDLKFSPTGIVSCHGQDIYAESWNKASKSLNDYINNLITTYEYKNKYPKPLEYTKKMTIPWMLKNLPVSTLLFLASFLVAAYGLGVKYHQPTAKLGSRIWQQIENATQKQNPTQGKVNQTDVNTPPKTNKTNQLTK